MSKQPTENIKLLTKLYRDDTGHYKIPTTKDELYTYLEGAMALEISTLPLYLSAYYSFDQAYLKDNPSDEVNAARKILIGVCLQEMLHMNIVSNLMTSIYGNKKVKIGFNIDYTNGLPVDVRKDIPGPIAPVQYSKDQLYLFTQIECESVISPSCQKAATEAGSFPYTPGKDGTATVEYLVKHEGNTIGEFYEAILDGIIYLNHEKKITFDNEDQQYIGITTAGTLSAEKITSKKIAKQQINGIILQGENYSVEPQIFFYIDKNKNRISIPEHDKSHFIKFVELLTGYEIQAVTKGSDTKDPNTYNMVFHYADPIYEINLDKYVYPKQNFVNKAPYDKFNSKFEDLLTQLETGLSSEKPSLGNAVGDMFDLEKLYGDLMTAKEPAYPDWLTRIPNGTPPVVTILPNNKNTEQKDKN